MVVLMSLCPISSIVHWVLCALVAVNAYIFLFCGKRVGGWGGRTIYGPTADFVLDAARYVFPAILFLGIVGFVRDRNKTIAVKVMAIAAFCTFLCWWKTLLLL